jgi:pimeloyl-ACP methyl ester carboxylesterase
MKSAIHGMTELNYTVRQMSRAEVDVAISWAALEGWNPGLTSKLNLIRVPVLLTSGEFDESTIHTTAFFQSRIWGSGMHVFTGASHSHHIEKPDEYVQVVGSFLEKSESKQ